MKAATYARFSSDAQKESSIDDQQRNCRRKADAEGWRITAQFSDAAMTGSNNQRPDYLRMIAAAARKEFDVLLIDDLSRLTRDSVEQERTIRRLEFSGIRLIAISDGYDSTSKSRKIHRQLKGVMNEAFSDDLSERVHRGSTGQALRGYWLGGRPYGYRLRPVSDPSGRLDPYGAPARIGTMLEPNEAQAAVVREIFALWNEGLSAVDICERLNKRGTPSPGSTWNRRVRRAESWVQTAVRGILHNPLYTGQQRWNTSRYTKDPDTAKDRRRARPQCEHIVRVIEALRLVSDETFERAAARFRSLADDDPRLKTGGRPKHLLSGQLKCAVCGSNYVLADRYKYACAGYIGGRACANRVWVRKDALEDKIVRPLDERVLEPRRVEQAVTWMRAEYARRLKAARERSAAAPREIADLDARLARLRGGVADLEPDELAAAIARVEAKRRDLLNGTATSDGGARVLELLPRAAKTFRATVASGLAGDPAAVAEARLILRPMLGPITLEPGEGGALWASYGVNFSALIKAAGTGGRGDRI
jgi:site-specific DNA recombinase